MCQLWVDASYDERTQDAGLGILIRDIIPQGIKETTYRVKTKAVDNNQAELLAILYGVRNLDNFDKLHIITDSQTAINCIKNPDGRPDKYTFIVREIHKALEGRAWKIYHKKGHSKNNDRYSLRQNYTDALAKGAKKLDNGRR